MTLISSGITLTFCLKYDTIDSMKNIKLRPRCLPNPDDPNYISMPLAINNRGYILPCCWCDEKSVTTSERFKKIYNVSKLENFDTVEQLMGQPEWKEFENDLVRARDVGDNLNKINGVCIHHCKVREKEDKIKVETTYRNGKELKKATK